MGDLVPIDQLLGSERMPSKYDGLGSNENYWTDQIFKMLFSENEKEYIFLLQFFVGRSAVECMLPSLVLLWTPPLTTGKELHWPGTA